MSKFKSALSIGQSSPSVEVSAAASFIAAADAHEQTPAAGAGIDDQPLTILPVPEYDQGGKLSDAVLFRCTPAVASELEFIFKHSTAKSKQKLLEALIIPQLRDMAKKIRGN